MVDFNLSPAQEAIRDAAAQFAAQHLTTARALYTDPLTPSAKFRATQPLYEKGVAAGLIKSQIPTTQGGTGGALIDAVLCVEELYAVDCSVSLTILATGLGMTPLILAGTEAQRQQFLTPFLEEGSPLASLVHSEPGGTANFTETGGDKVGLQTTVRREGETLIIDGDKVSSLVWFQLFFPPPIPFKFTHQELITDNYRCGQQIAPAGMTAALNCNASHVDSLRTPESQSSSLVAQTLLQTMTPATRSSPIHPQSVTRPCPVHTYASRAFAYQSETCSKGAGRR